jgi:signal transduction histidine kinase
MGACAWRCRTVPGAFALAMLWWLAVPWLLANALGLAAVGEPAKVFWSKFQYIWMIPIATAGLCFALEYANLDSWLNHGTLSVLSIPPLVILLLVFTNGSHHLLWAGFTLDSLHAHYSIAHLIVFYYGVSLLFSTSAIFIWLFVRSPLHRVPALLCLGGQLIVRIGVVLVHCDRNPIAPVDPMVVGSVVAAVLYALALFHFRMFDLVPVARRTVIDQMLEGMLVLDARQRVVDLNPSAERILGVPAARARGAFLSEFFPDCPITEPEVTLTVGRSPRNYALRLSPLIGPRGWEMGSLVLLYDVTSQRQAQAKLVEQQCAVATLRERDRVARELHDGLGQTLGFVKLQTLAARGFLGRGHGPEADECLARLAAVAQEAHADVREYINGARAGKSADCGFFPALDDYLRRFRQSWDVEVKLNVSSELSNGSFQPMVRAQLLRIIQEGLTNIRKHARANSVDIRLAVRDGNVEAVIEDDGEGFDPLLFQKHWGQKFGLGFMRERAEEVGGTIEIHSAPGAGSRVVVSVPLQKELQ